MEIDIKKIAMDLINKLNSEAEASRQIAYGVGLLYETIRQVAEEINGQAGQEQDTVALRQEEAEVESK